MWTQPSFAPEEVFQIPQPAHKTRWKSEEGKAPMPKFIQSIDAPHLTYLTITANNSTTSREIWRPLRDSNSGPQD
jgi:hypothetical protein